MEHTRFSIYHVILTCTLLGGLVLGGLLGAEYFGSVGGFVGGVIGLLLGHVLGVLPDWLSFKLMTREILNSSNEELRALVSNEHWDFENSYALLVLAARDQEVRGELPRITRLLESDKVLDRRYGWDALRLVFAKETARIEGYDPQGPTEECQKWIVKLKAYLASCDS